MASTPSSAQLDAALVATTLEYLRNQGRSASEIKRLFAPKIIDGWFAIKAESEPGVSK